MSSIEFWFSDSDSEEEKKHELTLKRPKIRDTANPLDMADTMFRRYFRISKEAFTFLLDILSSKSRPRKKCFEVPPVIKLTAALRFFAEGSYQKGVGNDFNVGLAQSTFSKILSEVLNIFEDEICSDLIKFPNEAERAEIKLAFFEKFGFPGIIGRVDGTHVRIISPDPSSQHLYYNRKGYHSLNVMLVCDHNMRITFVNSNNPGSCHDSFVWSCSDLYSVLEREFHAGERNTWILGDAGYPLKPYLITPFRAHGRESNTREGRFNKIHASARSIIERTIGVLKNTFRCLLGGRELHYKPEKVTQIVNVCCALHNLRLNHNLEMEEVETEADEDDSSASENYDGDDESAQNIRTNIMNSILL